MQESPYDSEHLLQTLLADHPDLLAGDQINADQPRRWLLITREMAVPGEQDGAARWSLDHLFLDQEAIATLVEVKRSSDTRIRREVIGQMLDYAANGVAYWSVEEMRATFETRCNQDSLSPDTVLSDFLGESQEPAAFWQKVKTNLQAGRVRLIFIADEIPPELRRVVEFLNSQMDPAEVLAIEVKQFVGQNLKTLVPRVLGLTETARQKKGAGSGESRQWDEPSFFDALRERRGEQEVAVALQLLEWAKNRGLRLWWGQGARDGSFIAAYDGKFGKNYLYTVWTYGNVELQFQYMKKPFDNEGKREEFAQRLGPVGMTISKDALRKRPSFPLKLLLEQASVDKFLSAVDWMLSEIKTVESRSDAPEPSA